MRLAGRRLFQLHASENDRGTPGSGHVDWNDVRDALRETGYDGRVVIEAFNPDVPQLAEFLKVWRRLESDQDTLARDGIRFLRELFA
ncbi:MAG: sugar phosphate isomerase/epimerase family protein [Thermoanaerobaculia bacterium]